MRTTTIRTTGEAWRAVLLAVAFAFLAVAAPATGSAQDAYPSRLIRIVNPFPPGTTADQIPRLVGEKLTARWGQPVIVEARPGATGNIGAELVATADPDGYTLLSTPPPPLVVNQNLYSKLKFDPAAFVPVCLMAVVPNVLVARKDFPARNLKELIDISKQKPGQLTYGSTGPGGTPQLTMEMLKIASGASLRDIPYRQGTAPVLTDLLGGRIDMMFINTPDALQHIKSGALKVFGVATETRISQLPEVPTIAESFPGFYSATWYAMMAPPRTPPEIAAKLSVAIADILKTTDVGAKLRSQSMIVVGASPAETAAFLKKEIERWGAVIRTAGIKVE